jgi:hypothetical protein
LYLSLGTPFFELPGPGRAFGLRGFVSARIDPAKIAAAEGSQPPLGEGTALTAALGGRLGKAAAFSLEGFYTAASLPDRVPSGWFSETPPISLQDFSLFGLGLLLDTAYFDLSGDLAWSRTPILGGDLYASLGLRAGNGGSRPRGTWQLSLAADGAGRNYTGSDGANPGAGFRAGGKFEWRHSRAGLFRIDTVVSGPGFTPDAAGDPGLDFDRGSLGFSYRPPVTALPLRLSRLSVEADRDARDGVKDSVGLSLSLAANPRTLANAFTGLFRRIPGRSGAPPAEPDGNPPADPGGASGGLPAGGASRQWGSLSFNLSGSLAGTPAGDWGPEKTGRDPSPWPVPGGAYRFESFKAGGELVWSTALNPGAAGTGAGRRNLRLKAGLDYTASAPALDEDFTSSRSFDLQAALSGGWGRFSIGLSCPAFPWESPAAPWELSLSWKVERQAELRRGQP